MSASSTHPPAPGAIPNDNWSEELSRALTEERRRAQKLVGPLRERLGTLEAALAKQVEHLVEQLVARQRRQYEVDVEDMARERKRLQTKREQLDAEQEQLTVRQTETRLQRRRIAEELRDERRRLRASEGHEARRGARCDADDSAHQAAMQVVLEKLQTVEEAAEQLRHDRDELARRLVEAEQFSADSVAPSRDHEEVENLKKRLDMAMSDLRDLRRRNGELESKVAAAGKAAATASLPPAIDWETRKRQLLAQLEAEDGTGDAERQEERLTIDGVIKLTDAVVQDKDREIGELKRLLDEQSQSVGSVAVGAAAFAEMFDQDEIVQQERQRLQELQVELQEKLRAAEIDLSVARAKIARERAEIEERRRELEDELSRKARHSAANEIHPDDDATKKPNRGRWLSHLGLKKKPDAE